MKLLGDIALSRDPPDIEHAEARYGQAFALSDELGMRPLQAHCHVGLGNIYVALGSIEEARAELSSAIYLFRSMDMTSVGPGGGRARKHIHEDFLRVLVKGISRGSAHGIVRLRPTDPANQSVRGV